jgi:hypothetical protein
MIMNNDSLEKYILENRQGFDVHVPPFRVWDRVDTRGSIKKYFIYNRRSFVYRAASILLVLGLSFLAQEFMSRGQEHPENLFARQAGIREIPELLEAHTYYNVRASLVYKEVEPVLAANPELKSDLVKELLELDNINKELSIDLKDNVATAEVVDAMIQNYRQKLQILEEIKQHLGVQVTHDQSSRQREI